jgi:hypothetical protein
MSVVIAAEAPPPETYAQSMNAVVMLDDPLTGSEGDRFDEPGLNIEGSTNPSLRDKIKMIEEIEDEDEKVRWRDVDFEA